MYIFDPDPFLLPSYRISPFKTEHITLNHILLSDNFALNYFNKKFGVNNWSYCYNGREAIKFALSSYNLQKNDLVTILTTSENFYISSCVTNEIETFCRWNREIVPETKIIFVNHEFGYPYLEMEKIGRMGLPIIEDCCTTFYSQSEDKKIGSYGDFSLYSFPKFFPIQIGGLIVSNKKKTTDSRSKLNRDYTNYIEKVMSFYLRNEIELLQKRKENFVYELSLFAEFGFEERFLKNDNIVPTSLLLKNNRIIDDLPSLKTHLNNHGIQSSIFYGEDCFFIPCHQNMNKFDIEYIFNSVMNFKNR